MTFQLHRIFQYGQDGEDPHQVSVSNARLPEVCGSNFGPGRGEIDIHHDFALVGHRAFDLHVAESVAARARAVVIPESEQVRG